MKTRKTASTSVEIALSRVCGPDDVITPDLAEDEVLRQQIAGRGAQNYYRPWHQVTPRAVAVWAVKHKRPIIYDHYPARRVRALIGRKAWDSYFKFTTERNPWDAAVSYYFFRTRDLPERPPISEWLRGGDLHQLQRNYRNIYTIGGKVAVDRIMRFERLADDMAEVWNHLGLPGEPELPRAKTNFRTDRRSYRDVLTEADAAYIRQKFAAEVELFGYEF